MIAVIDSGVANLASVMAALDRIAAKAIITTDPATIRQADRVILPGVGAAAPAMNGLHEKNLVDIIRQLTQPVLGICLGMQLLLEHSDESGGIETLGVIPGKVTRLVASPDLPVPHMGWNTLKTNRPDHPLLKNIKNGDYVYFVHSFAAPVSASTLATTEYGASFTATTANKNFFGCQFHPERSSDVGSQILKNFIAM
jgi:glutamine amidotransferase